MTRVRHGSVAINLAGLIFWLITLGQVKGAEDVKGHLVIIGGGEVTPEILNRFVELAGGRSRAHIRIIPMASDTPVESGASMVESLKKTGVDDAVSVLISREQAGSEEVLKGLNDATGIFFTGGDQQRLATNLVNTPVHRKLHELYQQGAVIAGTSAGAAIMSAVMITGEQRSNPRADNLFTTIQKDNVVTIAGLGFVTNAIIDQHFIARKRQNRLFGLVCEHPNLLGIGIDEATAIVVSPNQSFEVIGNGSVMIFDARGSPRPRVDAKGNLSGRNVRTHLLIAGERFDPSQ